MLQNARVIAFIVSELLKGIQQERGGGKITPSPTRIRVVAILILQK